MSFAASVSGGQTKPVRLVHIDKAQKLRRKAPFCNLDEVVDRFLDGHEKTTHREALPDYGPILESMRYLVQKVPPNRR